MPGKSSSSLSVIRIEKAIVTEIDFENQCYFVRSEMSEWDSYRIPIMSPYINSTNSSGIKICPQVGTVCLSAMLSDGTRCILGFIPADDTKGSLDAGFPTMTSEDIFIHGPEGNFIRVRSGGIIEIGASPICSSIYIPTRNILHQISENFILDTFAGSLEYKVARAEDDGDGHQKCFFSLNVKEFADDENEIVRIRSGALDNKIAFSLVIKDSGSGENTKISIELSKEGDINAKIEKDFRFAAKGKIDISAEQDIKISSKQNTDISTNQNMAIKGNNTKITGNTNITLQAPKIDIKGMNVDISNNALFPPLRNSPDMAALLAAVSAVVKVPLSGIHINTTVKI